jgi:hypothetical protein
LMLHRIQAVFLLSSAGLLDAVADMAVSGGGLIRRRA